MDTITAVRNNKGTPGNETTIMYRKHHRIKQGFIGYIKRTIDENIIGIVGRSHDLLLNFDDNHLIQYGGIYMWNTMILPIITSLIATGLGIFLVWLFNRKRQFDERANQIAHIMNEISDIKNKMANSLERSALETAKNEKLREEVKEDIHEIREDVQKINEQVSENRALVQGLVGVINELQSIVGGLQNIIRDNISSSKS